MNGSAKTCSKNKRENGLVSERQLPYLTTKVCTSIKGGVAKTGLDRGDVRPSGDGPRNSVYVFNGTRGRGSSLIPHGEAGAEGTRFLEVTGKGGITVIHI